MIISYMYIIIMVEIFCLLCDITKYFEFDINQQHKINHYLTPALLQRSTMSLNSRSFPLLVTRL